MPPMPQDLAAQICLALIPLFLLAAGQAIVMIGGGIDLSMPGVIAGSTMVGVSLLTTEWGSVSGGVAMMLLVGTLMGVLTGVGVVRLGVPPAVVSLTTLSLFSGLALGSSTSGPRSFLSTDMASIGTGVPAWLGVAALFGIGLHLVMERVVYGRWLRALGFNREAARAAGVPVGRVTVGAYALSGLGASLAAVFFAVFPERQGVAPGSHLLVDAIGAAVIGGVRLSGGYGRIGFVLAGCAVVATLSVLLSTAGVPPGPAAMIKAALLLLVAGVQIRKSVSKGPGLTR